MQSELSHRRGVGSSRCRRLLAIAAFAAAQVAMGAQYEVDTGNTPTDIDIDGLAASANWNLGPDTPFRFAYPALPAIWSPWVDGSDLLWSASAANNRALTINAGDVQVNSITGVIANMVINSSTGNLVMGPGGVKVSAIMTINAPITGSSGLTKGLNNSLDLTANNLFVGTTHVGVTSNPGGLVNFMSTTGGALTLKGPMGALASESITVGLRGTFALDSNSTYQNGVSGTTTGAAHLGSNRIVDSATINMAGGTFNNFGRANVFLVEVFNTLNLISRGNQLGLTTYSGGDYNLSVTALNRNPGSTLHIVPAGGVLGGAAVTDPNVFINTQAPGIMPYASTVLGGAPELVVYDITPGVGVRALSPTTTNTNPATWVPPDDVRLTSPALPPVGPVLINSLNLQSGANFDLFGQNLHVSSGAVVLNNATISNGTMSAGMLINAPGELIFHGGATTIGVSANIIDNGTGPVSVVKGAVSSVLNLTGNNLYTGATYINGGALRINVDANLGNGGDVVIGSGSSGLGELYALGGLTLNRNVVMSGGAIRATDGTVVAVPNNRLVNPGSGLLGLTSNNSNPASPGSNAIVDLGASQIGLTGDTALVLSDVVVRFSSPAALGAATLFWGGGDRSGEDNDVTMLQYTGGLNTVISNPIVVPASRFQYVTIDGNGSSLTLNGNFSRPVYNNQPGAFATANNTTLILDGPASDAFGLAAASGNIDVKKGIIWNGLLENRIVFGAVGGARNQADAVPSTIRFFSAANGGAGTYVFSALASEARIFSGISRPVTLNVDAGAEVIFNQNGTGGQLLQLYDDLIKTGGGTITLYASGNASATQHSARGNTALFDIQAGTVKFVDAANAAGAFAPINTNATTGVTDTFFDGGVDGTATTGVINYQIRNGAALAAILGTDTGGSAHTLHFGLTLNPSNTSGDVATIQVGDLSTDTSPQARKAMIVGREPAHTGGITAPATAWNRELRKTGIGTLTLNENTTSTRTWANSNASLNIVEGTVIVNAGPAAVNDPLNGVPVTMAAGTTLTVNGASTSVPWVRGSGAVNVLGSGILAMVADGSPAGVSVIGSLNIAAGAKLDVKDNDLVVTGLSAAAVRSLLVTGFNSGDWAGNGLTSSAAQNDPTFYTALGYADNAELGYATFSGQSVSGTDILVKYTFYGDTDLNGVVDSDDLTNWIDGFNGVGSQVWLYGDFDYSGVVDSDDLTLWVDGFLNTVGPLSASLQAEFSAALASGLASGDFSALQAVASSIVPEPASLSLLALGALALRRRRR